ncbi:MAG: tRNA dihydrouridine synthase DusB [Spirochaetes bacterium]|nr:tRNA dihydrouridine synthase DusB [Spirochaetota bacterium]
MIRIRNLVIDGQCVMAPLAGYTDSPFRRIVRKHGAAMTVTELASADGIIRGIPKTMQILRFHDSERPVSIQVFGNNPGIMAEAARVVESLGPDCIDINMGCPAPKVCRGGEGAGSALLRDPAQVFAVVNAVVRSVSLPVSAKIRIGWDDRQKNYAEIVRALESAGISMITVHGRTVHQKYTGMADWSVIREIKEMASVPVIGNGDIGSHDEAIARLRESGCDAVMVGRGALGNPWIFSGTVPDWTTRVDQMRDHCRLMVDLYGDYGVILMRKHFSKYIHGFRHASRWRERLIRVTTPDQARVLLESMREMCLEGLPPG